MTEKLWCVTASAVVFEIANSKAEAEEVASMFRGAKVRHLFPIRLDLKDRDMIGKALAVGVVAEFARDVVIVVSNPGKVFAEALGTSFEPGKKLGYWLAERNSAIYIEY